MRQAATLISLLTILTLAAAALTAPGCETSTSVSLPVSTLKYPHMAYQGFDYPPEQVLASTHESLRALKLRPTTARSTAIDGRFEVETALGRQMQINVVGTTRTSTKVEIEYMRPEDFESARIILQEIGARL